jgi:hypothetical protein
MYTLSFWLGNAQGSGGAYPLASSVGLAVTGLAPLVFTNALVTLDGVNWAFETVTFTASSASTTIMFTNATVGDNYAGLDDIVLDGPAPTVPDAGSTLLLLSLALPGLVAVPRLRRLSFRRG